MKFIKKDLIFSIFTGAGTGLIVWRILDFLHIEVFDKLRINILFHLLGQPNHQVSNAWLILVMPILWIIGVLLGYLLGRWVAFFSQFGKFAAIGFTNFAVDVGVLNLLIAHTGYSSGTYFSVFKTISFLVALVNSYPLNKYWAFGASQSQGGKIEFLKFASVAVFSILVNVGAASLVVNSIDLRFGFSPAIWANVGAILGSASALIFSFIGFKLLVFKNNHVANSLSKISS